jgi:hypothetical protein
MMSWDCMRSVEHVCIRMSMQHLSWMQCLGLHRSGLEHTRRQLTLAHGALADEVL